MMSNDITCSAPEAENFPMSGRTELTPLFLINTVVEYFCNNKVFVNETRGTYLNLAIVSGIFHLFFLVVSVSVRAANIGTAPSNNTSYNSGAANLCGGLMVAADVSVVTRKAAGACYRFNYNI